MTAGTAPGREEGGGLVAWLTVAMLLAAYAMSFVDRQILALLVGDLRRDLDITDVQIGLLQGPAFGLFYAVMGLPFGWLADRTHRVRLIAFGLAFWSVMTVLGGLSTSFEALFASRMGVGVGEAALVPAGVSLLADRFAAGRRALPLAIFTAGVSVGAGLALVLGGAMIAFAGGALATTTGIGHWFAGRAVWQSVLILAGLLGLPLAIAMLMLPEPVRERSAPGGAVTGLAAHLSAHRGLFAPLLAGSSLLYLFSNAMSAWFPSLFMRQFGWTASDVGVRAGVLVLGGALAGNLLSGAVATALIRRGHQGGSLLTMAGAAALLIPLSILGPLAVTPPLAQAAVALIYFAIALCFGVATASLVAVTPPDLRGRMIALYLLLGNLLGLGVGPPAVGLVLDRMLRDPARVGAALSLVAAASVGLGALLLLRAVKPHAALAASFAR